MNKKKDGDHILVLSNFILLKAVVFYLIGLPLVSPIFYNCSSGPSKQTEETINIVLNHSRAAAKNSTDTLRQKIYGDFGLNIITIKTNNKYGLYDTLQHKAITEVKYDNIGSFAYENAIDFTINKKYGYLNYEGREIVAAKYDYTKRFSHNIASVKLDGKYGYIDKKGKVIIPIEYEMAWDFRNGIGAVKKNSKWGFINPRGEYILDPIYDNITRDFDDSIQVANVSIGRQNYFINKKGKRLGDSKPFQKFTKQ